MVYQIEVNSVASAFFSFFVNLFVVQLVGNNTKGDIDFSWDSIYSLSFTFGAKCNHNRL